MSEQKLAPTRIAPKPEPLKEHVRTSDRFPNVLSPFKLNDKYTLRNRVACAPMVFAASVVGNDFNNAIHAEEKYVKLERPAAGGTAMVTVGELNINDFDGRRVPVPNIDFSVRSGEAFNAISEYAWRIKRHGAIALQEIAHPGSDKDRMGGEIWGVTDGVAPDGSPIIGMNEEMMESVINDFVAASLYLKAAGFDGVCVHGAHGFLFTQFLSPMSNTRTDEYGGSIENRGRFPRRVLKAIREAVGKDFIIELRISAMDGLEGGITVEDSAEFVKTLEGIITCIHISRGFYGGKGACKFGGTHPIYTEHGFNFEQAAYIKSHTNVPVGVVGAINNPELAERAIKEGIADYVIMARQMLADPEFVHKIETGREKEIRQCVGCMSCMPFPDKEQEIPWDGVAQWLKVGFCAINPHPELGRSMEEIPQPQACRKVVVVGGGPAGMQAAITAADRGHKVVLFDENETLGGTLFFTDIDVDKKDISDLKNTMAYQVSIRENIEVRLNTKVTPEILAAENADAVILAVGAVDRVLPIAGIENSISSLDVYREKTPIGKKVVMLGGGLVGAETGLHLAHTGHDVTVVDMLKRIAHESSNIYRRFLMEEIETAGMKTYVKTKVKEVAANGVTVVDEEGKETFLEADTIVNALGRATVDTSALEAAAGDAKVYVIGDCAKVGKIGDAIRTGFDAAIDIL